MRPSRSRAFCAVAALTAAHAMAQWSPEGRHVVVETDSVVALVDAHSGSVARAFPRRVTARMRPASVAAPLPSGNALIARGHVMLSQDGGRLANTDDGVDVWNVSTGKLELRIPKAHASALLGDHGEQVAVVRSRDGAAKQFGVWDVATGRCVFSQLVVVPEGVAAVRTDSARFAAFTVAQRELWLWSRDRGLQRVPLPRDFFVNLPLRFSADGLSLAVSGQSIQVAAGEPDRRIVVYDLRDGRVAQQHRIDRGNTPVPLGWTRRGDYLIANAPNSPEMFQYDARDGALRHRWQHVPPLRSKSDYDILRALRINRRLVGGVPTRADDAVMSTSGDRLALADAAWSRVVTWDVGVSPPRRLAALCEDQCGDSPVPVAFSPSGGELLVSAGPGAGGFWIAPLDGHAPRRVRADAAAMERIASELELPDPLPEADDRTRACEAGHRDACLAEGRFELACLMEEDERCLSGLRVASRSKAGAAGNAKPARLDAPAACRDLAYLRLAGVRVYEDGQFAGIRIVRIVGAEPGRWPFEEGDVLRNSIRCPADSCSPQRFLLELNALCRIPADQLLHELRLEVRSPAPERNRDIVLRRITP